MDEHTREQAFMSALVTEHFVLQSARSTTVTEANGRAAIYLTSVSSALVAFGFVAQVAKRLDPFIAAVLPALFVLGELTFLRLVENAIENVVFLEKIQQIRDYYRGLVPEAAQFFTSAAPPATRPMAAASASQDNQEAMAAALAGTGMSASPVEMLFTAASMVAAVNSIIGGVGIALLAHAVAVAGGVGTVLIGVTASLTLFGLHMVWQSRRGDAVLGWRAARRARGSA